MHTTNPRTLLWQEPLGCYSTQLHIDPMCYLAFHDAHKVIVSPRLLSVHIVATNTAKDNQLHNDTATVTHAWHLLELTHGI